jgi:hypothetical protein
VSNDTPGSAVGTLAAVNQRLCDLVAALALACEASGSGWATLAQVAARFDPPLDGAAQWRARGDLDYLVGNGVLDARVFVDGALEYRPRARR